MIDRKAIFVGCARDCGIHIPRVLQNVSRMAGLFAEAAHVFVENDSRDSTKHHIQLWCQSTPNARLISLDGLAARCPVRTLRIEAARNQYLSLIRTEFQAYDYLFIVDCDEINAPPIDLDVVQRAIAFLEGDASCAAVFGNANGVYYDMWAFRHRDRCPGDAWEEVCDYALKHRVSDEQAFEQTFKQRMFSLPMDAPPLEVESAFGGLGIYKIRSILENKRHYVGHKMKSIPPGTDLGAIGNGVTELGWQCCEHVSFNAGFRERGERLVVLPYLINSRNFGMRLDPAAWRTLLFDPRPRTARAAGSQDRIPDTVGRNQPCPCGSGRRYKFCHGSIA